MTDSGKHSSLLQYGNKYDCRMFLSTLTIKKSQTTKVRNVKLDYFIAVQMLIKLYWNVLAFG
jgi:hypothetical protein